MKKTLFTSLFIAMTFICFSQNDKEEHSPFDLGKMWTFEHAPTDWFEEEYGFKADEQWFEDVRLSALKFASWCSASFVSPDGLIMTNHHCSRDESIKAQQGNENFDNNGFYAPTKAEERKVEGLFVEQLIQFVDVTEEVMAYGMETKNEAASSAARAEGLKELEAKYAAMPGWENLRVQGVTFYSGGKYSIYGFKKYSDIRLVLIPENDLGFYGGDPDNFTYPRYNLDCTFWRAYDEDGKPLNTSAHYFKFNIDGIKEGTPVFVVGNPARTERYRTVAQLEYDRDYRYKQLLRFLTNRRDRMQTQYDVLLKDASKVREAQELMGNINNFSNSIKAYNGIIGGLHNPKLMGRKKSMESHIRSQSNELDYWEQLEDSYGKLEPHAWASTHLGPSRYRGRMLNLMHSTYNYMSLLEGAPTDEEITTAKEEIKGLISGYDKKSENDLFKMLLGEIRADIHESDNTLTKLLDGKSDDAFLNELYESDLFNSSKLDKCLSKGKKFINSDDALMRASRIVGDRYENAKQKFQVGASTRKALEGKIANQAFNVYGTDLPPDATFTLRISDGVVKGYEYNGTDAPYMTTYFGMYDRHYSHGQVFPWSLPEKWADPSMDLLKSPLNFVTTNDIIGGNSGSAMINQNKEAVGLIFDGNIESLPGNFIFDEEYNRCVTVHAGGIYAALKYVYKADALVEELLGK